MFSVAHPALILLACVFSTVSSVGLGIFGSWLLRKNELTTPFLLMQLIVMALSLVAVFVCIDRQMLAAAGASALFLAFWFSFTLWGISPTWAEVEPTDR